MLDHHAASPIRQTALAAALLLAFGPLQAQETQPAPVADPNMASVVVLGSRSVARTALDSAAPVGLIGAKDIQMAGPQELGKLLQTLDPSFNFSTTFISDGTDIIRPPPCARSVPDQILVLVNGKRRHQQALVNVQQTIGRGSAGTDINAIPLSAIQRIEVLRDGAAAQYGSDAIAGVINIVLKQQTGETQLSGSVGGTSEGGGRLTSGSANTGWALGDGGFVNLTLEGRRRGETNRAGLDTLRVDPPRVTQRIGDSLAKDKYFWWNAGLPVAGTGGEFYSLRRRLAPHRRFGRLLPLQGRRTQRAGRVPGRLPAEHPHHGQGRLAGSGLAARPGGRLEARPVAQPRPQRARFPREEHDQRQLLVRAEAGRRHLRRVAASTPTPAR
jgi:iron complex outermembrane receptor protein